MSTAAIVAIALPFVKPLGVTVAQAVRIASYLKDDTAQGLAIRTAAAERCVWAVAAAAIIFAHQVWPAPIRWPG